MSTIVCESEGVVAEGTVVLEVFGQSNPDLEFVLSARVSYYLPVMHSSLETLSCQRTPKQVRLLLQETVTVVLGQHHSSSHLGRVPSQQLRTSTYVDCPHHSRTSYFGHYWCSQFGSLHELADDLVHDLFVAELLDKLMNSQTSLRTARLGPLYTSIQRFLADLEVPAFRYQAGGLMLGQIDQFKYFVALGVAALDVEVVVHPEEGFATDGDDVVDGTAVGALVDWVFLSPAADAYFAEEFATGGAFERVYNNVQADQAVECLVFGANEAFWVVAGECHFCWDQITIISSDPYANLLYQTHHQGQQQRENKNIGVFINKEKYMSSVDQQKRRCIYTCLLHTTQQIAISL